MSDLERFVHELQDALVHLYDPDYTPTEHVYAATGCDPAQGPAAVQSAIIESVRNLEPDAGEPPGSRARRDYEVLHHRFIRKLTQEETAERLCLSVRSVQREQRRAVYMLARRFWEHERSRPAARHAGDAGMSPSEATRWTWQVRQELLSLQRHDPNAKADLEATIQGAVRIARATATRHGITVETGRIQPNLLVRFHPSALRQVLLTAITELEQSMSSGTIALSAQQERDRAQITITARPTRGEEPIDASLAQELLSAQGGSIEFLPDKDSASLAVRIPIAEGPKQKATVLAIDDNADLITLYKSYCTGTRYEILHVQGGQRALEAIQAHAPDIILLDVMLPDVDGWDLLLDLRANPATRAIPIIVCSVITDEELALTLGAVLYLRKPVWRGQLIDAFDQVFSQVAAGA